MADSKDEALTGPVFKALADTTRRQILQDLGKSPLPAGEVASKFPISGPSISRHLAVLKTAGLVTEQRQANKIIYSLVPERLANCVFPFVFSLCPGLVEEHLADQVAPAPAGKIRQQSRKKPKGPDKTATKQKRKAASSKGSARDNDGGRAQAERNVAAGNVAAGSEAAGSEAAGS